MAKVMTSAFKRTLTALNFSKQVFVVFSLAIVLGLFMLVAPHWTWESPRFDSVIDSVGSIAIFSLAILFLLNRSLNNRHPHGRLAVAVMAQGLLCFLGSATEDMEKTLWLNRLATALLALGFLVDLTPRSTLARFFNRFFTFIAGAVLALGLFVFIRPDFFPSAFLGDGFSPELKTLSLLTAFMFLLAVCGRGIEALGPNRDPDSDVFVAAYVLCAATSMVFPFTQLWSARWWIANSFQVIPSAALLGVLFIRHSRRLTETCNALVRSMSELQATEQRLRQFVEESPYSVAMLDNKMCYVYVSRAWTTEFLLADADVRGKRHYDIVPNISEQWKLIHQDCLRGGTAKHPAEAVVGADGILQWRRWEVRPWYSTKDEVGGILIFAENITDRILNEVKLQHISDTLPVFVAYVDQQERVQFANREYLSWIGMRSEQVLNQSVAKIFGEEAYESAKSRVMAALRGQRITYDLDWTDGKGKSRTYQFNYVPDLLPDGMVVGFVMHGQDVTDLRLAVTARDEFLSIASHELKTPLTALKLRLQIDRNNLLNRDEVPTKARLLETFDLEMRQVASLSALVEDFLDVSRIRTGRLTLTLEECDVRELIEGVVNAFAETLKVVDCEVKMLLHPNLIGRFDRRRLEQVLVNLLSNSIKYAPGSPLQISAERNGTAIRIRFEDFGPGLPSGDQSRIFAPYVRGQGNVGVGGMGLGLYIVQQIVQAHNGLIRVESELGMGTHFTIDLPLTENAENFSKPALHA